MIPSSSAIVLGGRGGGEEGKSLVKRRREGGAQDHWTLDEDEKLSQAVGIFTDPTKLKRKRINWDLVSKYMDECRSSKQCYSRWTTTAMHNLDGNSLIKYNATTVSFM